MSSGLATKIASSSTSSTFDLCHLSSSTITAIVSTAFSKPLPITDMIRLTFIVGGGKATRGKYDEGALTAVVGALRGCGYREERGGGCVLECAGSYKVQHDTGKNLRTVVVFPLIRGGEEDVDEEEEEEEVADEEGLIPAGSVGYKIAVCPMASFISLLSLHCPTYLQKKQCLRTLSGLIELQSAIEHKMMNGQRLDASEKSFYDSSIELSDKMEHVQKEATKHIEEGNLTYEERKILIEMNEKRIQSLMNEENSASVADQLKKALARKELLNRNTGEATLPPLRLEIISETKALSEKDDLEREIERLESASRGWFEEEECFVRRVQASRDQFEAKHAKNARGGKASVGGGGSARSLMSSVSGSTKWILPDSNKLKGNKNAWGSTATKRRNNGGGAVFSAMMMDSSSEEETDDDDKRSDSFVRTVSVPKLIPERQSNLMKSPKSMPNIKSVGSASRSSADSTLASLSPLTASSKTVASLPRSLCFDASTPPEVAGSETKSKKKKKRSKASIFNSNGGDPSSDIVGNDAINDTSQGNGVSKFTPDESTVSQSLVVFASHLLQLVLAILYFLLSIVTGVFTGDKTATTEKHKGKRKVG
ncbi:hypothetical protein HJC23_006395 [Cyclotella cryptica]|uniref:Uncharacterized protein n=1 Tax=Cyclotella cryptica TaxID=29204 RepID=A0ABD3QUX6_9STRA